MSDAPPRVLITDVTLREFGQNVSREFAGLFATDIRVQVARGLISAGVTCLEILSCVHSKVAPAMAREALADVASGLGRVQGVEIVTLVPNKAGYRTFLDLGLGPDGYGHVMGLFVSAVEEHNRANLGRSIQETLKEYEAVARDAAGRGTPMNGYVSAAFGYRDPDRGRLIAPSVKEISALVDRLFDMGAQAVTLSDLQGVADEAATQALLEGLLEHRGGRDLERIGYHPHHVSGEWAVANSLVALNLGIRRFDASLGGTGGCVTGAPGNQPTEGLVRRFHEAGVTTGIDEKRLGSLAAWIKEHVYDRIPTGRG